MEKKMTSGEMAKKAGVSQKAIRLYDEKGLLKPTEYSEGNYRLYDDAALQILEKIVDGRPSSKLMFCSGHTFTHLPHEMQASVLWKGSSETHLWNDLAMTFVLKRGKMPRRISVTDLQSLIFWITSGRCALALAILRFAVSGLSVLMPAMLT